MKRWVLLLACMGAVAVIGGTPLRGNPGVLNPSASLRAGPLPPSPGLERGRREAGAGRDSGPREDIGLMLPSGGCLIVDGVVRIPCRAPDVRGFHPYPECEIVGMPFAGVKMCE